MYLSGFDGDSLDLSVALCGYVYDGNAVSYLGASSSDTPYYITLTEAINYEQSQKEQN